MRLLILFFVSTLFFQGCTDDTSSDPNVVLLLIEKWPVEWNQNGTADFQSHAALKQLTEKGVVFSKAFTASPEKKLVRQTLQSGMHTGHLLSNDFDKKNLDNLKNALLSKNYRIQEYSRIVDWSSTDKINPAVHFCKINSNNLAALNGELVNLLANVTPNTLIVLTALSGAGTAYSESSLRVPLIFYTGDDKVKKGSSQQAIYTADLFPTIADFLNAPYDGNTLDGKSFYKNIKRPTTPLEDRILYWKSSDKEGPEILRYNQWKMRRVNPQTEWQLFDMITDPEETDNVSAYHPGKFEKFQEWVEKNK